MPRPIVKTAFMLLTVLALALSACAPDNLDITPSPTPTNTPEPTATRTPTPTPNPDATEAAEGADAESVESSAVAGGDPFEAVVAAFPEEWDAGAQWRRSVNETTEEPVTHVNLPAGRTVKIYYTELGGSQAEITFGIFDTAEAAETFYNNLVQRTLENADENPDFPTPNRFGRGTYGQDALMLIRDNVMLRVSIPRYNISIGDDPMTPMVRAALQIVESVIPPAAS